MSLFILCPLDVFWHKKDLGQKSVSTKPFVNFNYFVYETKIRTHRNSILLPF